jgi:hypothetical protein
MINRIVILTVLCNFAFTVQSKDIFSYFISMEAYILTDTVPEYHPMAIEGANWVYKTKDEGQIGYYGWSLKGDTIINGENYKKGFKIRVDLLIAPPHQALEYSINPNVPDFYIRDDTIQKKVYAIYQPLSTDYKCNTPSGSELEIRIFEFDVQIDSSIYCPDGYPMVPNIDTAEYFGYLLPRNTINDGERVQYQQIGDPKGLFFEIDDGWVASYHEELIEYCVNDEVGCPHELPLSSNEVNTNNELITLYPNPASEKVTISSEETIRSIEIYSLDGRRLLNRSNIHSLQIEIKLSQINSQVLVALIKMDSGKTTRLLFHKN